MNDADILQPIRRKPLSSLPLSWRRVCSAALLRGRGQRNIVLAPFSAVVTGISVLFSESANSVQLSNKSRLFWLLKWLVTIFVKVRDILSNDSSSLPNYG